MENLTSAHKMTAACRDIAEADDALPIGVTRTLCFDGVTEYRLDNGLRFLLIPDASWPSITVNITYFVGSRDEGWAETGTAHLLEHLLFRGSLRHTDINLEMTEHGADANADTWYDRTSYYETFTADDNTLAWALSMEADRMNNALIAEPDVQTEVSVVLNEIDEAANDPIEALSELTLACAYHLHPYGRAILGARRDVANASAGRLQEFYQRHYRPDNAMLLIAGRFDPRRTAAIVAASFGSVSCPAGTASRLPLAEPIQQGERSTALRRSADAAALCSAYHIPAASHPDYAAIDILGELLGDTPSGLLHRCLVQSGIAASVYAYPYALRDPGVIMFGAELRKGAPIEHAGKLLADTVESLETTPLSEDDVETARRRLLDASDASRADPEAFCEALADWEAIGDWRLFFLHRDRLKQVTVEQIWRAAARYLKPSNRTEGVLIPTAMPSLVEVPTAPDGKEALAAYSGGEAAPSVEWFELSPEDIDRRTETATAGTLTLSLLRKPSTGKRASAVLELRYGSVESLRGRRFAGQMAGEMLMRGCTGRTRRQIADAMSRLGAHVAVSAAGAQTRIELEVKGEYLPDAIRVLSDALSSPGFQADELEQLKAEVVADYAAQRLNPQSTAERAAARHCAPYSAEDPRYVPTIEECIAGVNAITSANLSEFYAQFFPSARRVLAAVGAFDSDAVRIAADEFRVGCSARSSYAPLPHPFVHTEAINVTIETPDRPGAVLIVTLPLRLRDDDLQYSAISLACDMLGVNSRSRLWMRLRERDGLSYDVGALLQAGAHGAFGCIKGYAICRPEDISSVETAFREELLLALQEGFSQQELESARAGYLRLRALERTGNDTLAKRLAHYAFSGRRFEYDAALESRIGSLTPPEITDAMRAHIDLSTISIFKAGDFARVRLPAW